MLFLGGIKIRRKTILYDMDVMSIFLWNNCYDLLKANFSRIIISNINYKKLNSPNSPKFLKEILEELIKESFIKVEEIHIPSETFNLYCTLMNHYNDKVISKAEASSLALVIKNNGFIACNDPNMFMPFIKKYDLEYTTISIILLNSYKKKILSKEETIELWNKMYFNDKSISKEDFLNMIDEI